MKRRSLIRAASAGALISLGFERGANASVVRGLSLEELSGESGRILVGRALDFTSQWVTIGGRRRIVTDTRVRVEDVLAKDAPSDSEVMIRTLGGTIGTIAALVHGEAEIAIDQPCVMFLRSEVDGVHRVTGMAQGHYPVLPDVSKIQRLRPSPRANEVVAGDRSALRRLVGRELLEARSMIREAIRR